MQFSMQVVILYHYLLENLACYCKKLYYFEKLVTLLINVVLLLLDSYFPTLDNDFVLQL